MNYKHKDEQAAGKSDCKAEYIDDNVCLVSENVSVGGL
jgi:hypothetical protein